MSGTWWPMVMWLWTCSFVVLWWMTTNVCRTYDYFRSRKFPGSLDMRAVKCRSREDFAPFRIPQLNKRTNFVYVSGTDEVYPPGIPPPPLTPPRRHPDHEVNVWKGCVFRRCRCRVELFGPFSERCSEVVAVLPKQSHVYCVFFLIYPKSWQLVCYWSCVFT